MTNFEIGMNVQVTMGRIGQEPMVFNSEIVDIVDNHKENGVWVDHPECRGEDMLYINLSNPHINKVVEIIEETTLDAVINREHSKQTDMKDAHKQLDKAFKYEDDEIRIMVRIYDCFEDARHGFDAEQTYDVEIAYAIGDDVYTDCIVTDTYSSNIEGDEVAEKDAVNRAKVVLRTVKGWFKYSDNVVVTDGVEVYHA